MILGGFGITVVVRPVEGTIHTLKEYLDFWNVDLGKHEYFKNLPSQRKRILSPSNVDTDAIGVGNQLKEQVLECFQKKKAILDYISNLFFGTSPFHQESDIPFDPRFGKAWRPYFIRKYGWQGQALIEALGKGYSLESIQKYGLPREVKRETWSRNP